MLAACSSIPQNIKGNNQPDIQKSFVAVHNQPGLYVGQQARFGGKVINVINGKTDTLLEIAVLPLDSYAKPDIEANYQGRLLARQSGFLDPVNYRNHFVTILGTIQGEQPGFINKVPYNFLEVNMQGIQVWHLREVVNTTYNPGITAMVHSGRNRAGGSLLHQCGESGNTWAGQITPPKDADAFSASASCITSN